MDITPEKRIAKANHDLAVRGFSGPEAESLATLYVTGKSFAGGIVFGYLWGKWWLWECPPYLKAVIGLATVEEIIPRLNQRGFTTQWVIQE